MCIRMTAGAGSGDERRHRRVGPEAARVVDDVGAGVERGPGHGRFHGVDRDEDPGFRSQLPDDGEDPADLLLFGDGKGAGPGALAADVEDVRPFAGEGERVVDGAVRVEESAPVGEGIGGDVDDPHEPGRRAE